MKLESSLRTCSETMGVDFYGVADLAMARDAILAQGGPAVAEFPRAISIGIGLLHPIVDQLPQHPLACYLFSESAEIQNEIIDGVQAGGACINNCVFHAANPYLPFGGVGESGIGAYHGFHGFECFSHKKGVLKSATWIDIPLAYAPYKNKINILRKFLK